jgi:hypothetical protein
MVPMSQRDGESGRLGDEAEERNSAAERDPDADGPLFPATRPIAPYDPYRTRRADAARPAERSFDVGEPPPRRPGRAGASDLFLPDDDPLNADAWQLELDDTASVEREPTPGGAATSAPRRRPRRAAAARTEREAGARPARRARATIGSEGSSAEQRTMSVSVPRVMTGSPLAADQPALILLGAGAVGILLMALVLGVRLGTIPSPTVLRLDVAGNPDRWGPPGVLWRLPLMTLAITLMALVVAWFLYPLDRFGARFALASAVVAQLIAWVAVIQHLA